jgi:hypothetical protein
MWLEKCDGKKPLVGPRLDGENIIIDFKETV